MLKKPTFFVLTALLSTSLFVNVVADEEPEDPAEIQIGERLFLETRFAQVHAVTPGKADPALRYTHTASSKIRGAFKGKNFSCRSCHMVDEHQNTAGAGMRTYADFATISPITNRHDGSRHTLRNSMSMVNISLPRKQGELFHYDGEFNSMEDLVFATLTGRNFGWLNTEYNKAIRHIASVVRNDNGKGELAREFGGSYRKILKGTAKDIPAHLRLPEKYRIDIDKASDKQIVMAVSKLISAYVRNLEFSRDGMGNYNASPYDRFLILNKLPRKPEKGESDAAYSKRLATAVNKLKKPVFVSAGMGKFKSHRQKFVFGPTELKGMKLFFNRGAATVRGGNCVKCHSAPHFSDYRFHNTGLTELNYDEVHGYSKFRKLNIPDLATRNRNHDIYLPATVKHPNASSMFRSALAKNKPGYTDLGLWNVFANPDMPAPQKKIRAILCSQAVSRGRKCSDKNLLSLAVASFKTPVLRDLGHSGPYMHTGQFRTLEEVLSFYIRASLYARSGQFRNQDPAMAGVNLTGADSEALIAFLKALNEDYD